MLCFIFFLLNAMCRYLSLHSETTKPIMCIQTLNTFDTKISKCSLECSFYPAISAASLNGICLNKTPTSEKCVEN